MLFLSFTLYKCSKTYAQNGLKLPILVLFFIYECYFEAIIYNECYFAQLYITKRPQHPTPPAQASAPHAHTRIYARI